jgi:Leucine-rich repeat (LRR) protein
LNDEPNRTKNVDTQLEELEKLTGKIPIVSIEDINRSTLLFKKKIEKRTGKIPKIKKWYKAFGIVVQDEDVIRLGLHKKALTNIPESIGNLTSLQELYLGDNNLETLPESIGNLTNLQKLRLDDNYLTSIPESIGNLTKPRELNIAFNELTSLPISIGNLIHLTNLGLMSNKFSYLPVKLLQWIWTLIERSSDFEYSLDELS